MKLGLGKKRGGDLPGDSVLTHTSLLLLPALPTPSSKTKKKKKKGLRSELGGS